MRVGAVRVDLLGERTGEGLLGWEIDGLILDADVRAGDERAPSSGDGAFDLDGISTRCARAADAPGPQPPEHPLGATRIDHVVAMTPDLSRTLGRLGEVGLDLRRTREVPGSSTRQAFFRLGEVVLEVVGDAERAGDGPARLRGLVLVVADEARASEVMGDHLGPWKDAVQPGRRIATARPGARLGTAVAVMTS